MRVVIVGMGVQGLKRKKILGKNFIYSVDKFKKSDFKNLEDVPKDKYDTVFLCVPDDQKFNIAKYCLENKKNILIEKPLMFKNNISYSILKKLAKKNNCTIYTAYNHRFEPGLVKIKELIKRKVIGKLYTCRMFYGNGTSLLVKKSNWRDQKLGVISDIGSHLIDICLFIFDGKIKKMKLSSANKFENNSYDHSIINLNLKNLHIQLEMTLCSWENTFNFDLIGSKGSLHMRSLCKWSNSSLIIKKRKYPSGKPKIKKIVFKKGDPTWKLEHKYFSKIMKKNSTISNLKKDQFINKKLNNI